MKIISTLLAVVLTALAQGPASAHKPIASCLVTEVKNTSFFEESLSVKEYPELNVSEDDFDGIVVRIGASKYSEGKGDQITLRPSVGFDTRVVLTPKGEEITYILTVQQISLEDGTPYRVGVLSAREDGGLIITVIAKLSC